MTKYYHGVDIRLVRPHSLCLRCRNIDVGDVSPADLERFTAALRADVDGVQVSGED